MPIIYPGNVLGWQEIMPGADPTTQVIPLYDALGLLIKTFPGRYEKFSPLALCKKMQYQPLGNTGPAGLRVWTHVPNHEMCAFFFLRNKGSIAPIYAMSVGLAPAFATLANVAQIYTNLLPLCQFMVNQATGSASTTTAGGLEILNDKNTSPANGNAVLMAVINYANTPPQSANMAVVPDQNLVIPQSQAWPPSMLRWILNP